MQLHRARERFDQAGAVLALIGQLTPRHAAHFARRLGIGDDVRILTDEERATYRIAGFRRGSLSQLLGPRSVAKGIAHGARSRVVQGRIIGDAAQLGGALVVLPGGEVALHRPSRHAGDTIEVDDLLAAVPARS